MSLPASANTLPICCLIFSWWRLNVTSYLQSNVPAALHLDSFLHLCWHVTSDATKWLATQRKNYDLKHQHLQDRPHSRAFCLHQGHLRHFTRAVAKMYLIVIKLTSRLAGQYHDLNCQTILMYPLLHICHNSYLVTNPSWHLVYKELWAKLNFWFDSPIKLMIQVCYFLYLAGTAKNIPSCLVISSIRNFSVTFQDSFYHNMLYITAFALWAIVLKPRV